MPATHDDAPPADPTVLVVDFIDEQHLAPWQRAVFALACRSVGERATVDTLTALLREALHGRI